MSEECVPMADAGTMENSFVQSDKKSRRAGSQTDWTVQLSSHVMIEIQYRKPHALQLIALGLLNE